jgi:hypothetical protein
MKTNSKRKTNKPAQPQTLVPLRDQIEIRAYQIWIAGGGGHGRDVENWLQAETEILNGRKLLVPTACSEVED